VKNTAKCPHCGQTVRTVKYKGVRMLAGHDHPDGGMCQGAYTRPT
jgi:hypothetical protein